MSRISPNFLAGNPDNFGDKVVYKSTTASAAVTFSDEIHGNREYVINAIIVTGAHVMTLPKSVGNGDKYIVRNLAVQTQALTLKAAGSDVMKGSVKALDSSALATHATAFYKTNATQASLNASTTGGGMGGDILEVTDVAPGVWALSGEIFCVGAPATPLS